MVTVVEYKEFVSDIFNRLSLIQKHKLFYFSLFDPSSWEELERYPELGKLQKEIDEEVVKLMKETNFKFYRKHLKSKEARTNFLRSFVYNGDLCSFMIAAALNEKKIATRVKPVKSEFPDLVILVKGEEEEGVEIKRLLSCANLKERVDHEIVKPLQDRKWKKSIKLLFLFPQVGTENPHRIQQIIEGFYALEDYIRERAHTETKLQCRYVEREYQEDSPYSFGELIDNLSKWIFK